MHPDTLFSFVTSKRFIPLAIVIVIVLAVFFYGIESQGPHNNTLAIVSPTPLPIAWKTYQDTQNSYVMQTPKDWQNSDSPDINVKSFIYTEAGKQYSFNVFPPANVAPELSLLPPGDTSKKELIYIDGKQFNKITLFRQEIPYKILVIPQDPNIPFYTFVMNLPPTNTQRYIDTFNQIIGSIRVTGNYSP